MREKIENALTGVLLVGGTIGLAYLMAIAL